MSPGIFVFYLVDSFSPPVHRRAPNVPLLGGANVKPSNQVFTDLNVVHALLQQLRDPSHTINSFSESTF